MGAAGKLDRAIKDFDQAITLDPKNAPSYTNRGVAFGVKGDIDRALADYRAGDQAQPDLRLCVLQSRQRALRQGATTTARIESYNEAVKLNPNDPVVYHNRGNAYANKRDLDRAIADQNQAIKLNPNYALAYNDRGLAYGARGDIERALADFDQSIKLDPKNALAYYNRGLTCATAASSTAPSRTSTAAIKLNRECGALYARGNAYLRQARLRPRHRRPRPGDQAQPNDARGLLQPRPRFASARSTLDGAISAGSSSSMAATRSPSTIAAWSIAAAAISTAMADFDQAIKLDPRSATLATAAQPRHEGRHRPRHRRLRPAIKLDPRNARAFTTAALPYRNKGDFDRALADFDQAVKLDPNYAMAFYNRGNASS